MDTLYVTTEGNLTCILTSKDLILLDEQRRWVLVNATMLDVSVAADSRHVSASLKHANTTRNQIMLTYEDSAKHMNILHLSWLDGTTATDGNETG